MWGLLYGGFCCCRMHPKQDVNLIIMLRVHCIVFRKKAEEECRRRERNPSKSDEVSDKWWRLATSKLRSWCACDQVILFAMWTGISWVLSSLSFMYSSLAKEILTNWTFLSKCWPTRHCLKVSLVFCGGAVHIVAETLWITCFMFHEGCCVGFRNSYGHDNKVVARWRALELEAQ